VRECGSAGTDGSRRPAVTDAGTSVEKKNRRVLLFLNDALENAMFLGPAGFPARPFARQTT